MPQTIQLFVTCLVDTLYPEIGESVLRVLEAAGVAVDFPVEQTCCGQPAFNAGMRRQARQMAVHTIATLEQSDSPVVVPSGSCAAMIRHGYPQLFAAEPGWRKRAQDLAARTYELSEYLVDQLGISGFAPSFNGKLAYHASCHLLRDLGVDHQPRHLLGMVRGAEIGDLPYHDECCGFGGVFSVEHPEISSAMLSRKIENIQASGADWIVSCDAGCIANINGGLHRNGMPGKAVHIAQVLDPAQPLFEEAQPGP